MHKDARDAVRDAYAALVVKDMLDTNFDAEFARMTRLHVRRMAAKRICQDELDINIAGAPRGVEVKKVIKLTRSITGASRC